MKYETVNEDEQERLTFEVVVSLPVDQFEKALTDDSILLDEAQLQSHLHVLEQDHVRQTVRKKVSPAFEAPADGVPPTPQPAAVNPALIEDLERRIDAIKGRLALSE